MIETVTKLSVRPGQEDQRGNCLASARRPKQADRLQHRWPSLLNRPNG